MIVPYDDTVDRVCPTRITLLLSMSEQTNKINERTTKKNQGTNKKKSLSEREKKAKTGYGC